MGPAWLGEENFFGDEMKDQIVMSPRNGACCVAIPLFRNHEMEDNNFRGYGIKMIITEEKPVAYAIDYGDKTVQLLNAEWVEKNLEFIGEL